jgi:hypothetical protein
MVYGWPYEGFQKIPHIVVPISRHSTLLFHVCPKCLLVPMTFFDVFSVHGGELNCGYVV